jgi:FkbM family methyltransferase
MKRLILDLIRRAVGTNQVLERLERVESRTAATVGSSSFPIQNWWERSYWEPTVALAIRDHCRPGHVVFDVGANAGALSMMMSRLVGPRGIVCAFEASPRIIDKTQYNLVNAGCTNVTLYHKAVWHKTSAVVNLTAGSHLNDRIEEGATGMAVRTLALDDFVAASNLRPSFIKMDIEGAEFDALRGMERLLREARPILVVEQSPSDMRCHELLTKHSYVAVDLATYRPIRTQHDFPAGTGIANLLFVPQESADKSPYFAGAPKKVAVLSFDRFDQASDGSISMPEPPVLSPGRYIIQAEFTAEGIENEVFAGVEADGEVILRYHTYTRFMAESYTRWVVHLDREARIAPYLRFLRGNDPTLRWNGAAVFRISAFDSQPSVVVE